MTNLRSGILAFLREEWERLDLLETQSGRSKDDTCRWRLLRRTDEGSLEEQGLVSIIEECLRKFNAVNLQGYDVADVQIEGTRLR